MELRWCEGFTVRLGLRTLPFHTLRLTPFDMHLLSGSERWMQQHRRLVLKKTELGSGHPLDWPLRSSFGPRILASIRPCHGYVGEAGGGHVNFWLPLGRSFELPLGRPNFIGTLGGYWGGGVGYHDLRLV